MRRLAAGLAQHAFAGVESDDLSEQMTCQKSGSAGDVECAKRRKSRHELFEPSPVLVPAGPLAIGVQPVSEPPVVVLGGAPIVVGLHRS